jgi:hypothetical protein
VPWYKIGSNQHDFIHVIKTTMNPNEEQSFVLPYKIAMIYAELEDDYTGNIGNYWFVKPTTNELYTSMNFDTVAILWSEKLDNWNINHNQCVITLQLPHPQIVKFIFVCFPDWSEYDAVLE